MNHAMQDIEFKQASYRSPNRWCSWLATLVLVAASWAAAPKTAQAFDPYFNATVGGVLSPGVYGQITLGSRPPPPLLYPQPIIVQRAALLPPPMYLYVPPGHAKKWSKHCHRYSACFSPVYFLDEVRYGTLYGPSWRGGQPPYAKGRGNGNANGNGNGNSKGKWKD